MTASVSSCGETLRPTEKREPKKREFRFRSVLEVHVDGQLIQ